jgi:hypothetical protein
VTAEGALVGVWRKAFTAQQGIELTSGLTDAEIESAEAAYDLSFPPDLRACLQAALPVDADDDDSRVPSRLPNWRDLTHPGVVVRLQRPWGSILTDLQINPHVWIPEWGTMPDTLPERIRLVRAHYVSAARLIPIFGHRYLPSEPAGAGNPVLSVHQMDIIYYGCDLADYLEVEFLGKPWGQWEREPGRIRFWSDIVDHGRE